jgi:hypothetical protein
MQPNSPITPVPRQVGRVRLLYGPFMAALAHFYTCRVHIAIGGDMGLIEVAMFGIAIAFLLRHWQVF